MTSSKETPQEPPRNGLRPPPPLTPFNNEPSPSHQSHHTVLTDPVFNPKRSSQRNKHSSIVPDSLSPNLKRRTSRFGLSSLFSRSKPLATEGVQEKLGVQWECDEPAGTSKSAETTALQKKDSEPRSPEIQARPDIDPPAAPLRSRTSKSALRSSFRREITSRSSAAWDPPPLFQAYPQAVRHATLRAPALSAETILRLNAERNGSSNQRVESYTPEVNGMKSSKEKKLKRPTALDVLSKGDWTKKTFVLITSGYFLQYAGQGPFDRLPEKIMSLTKESAAFASDAIPGKPYVLQISQVAHDNGSLDTEASRSMFKNLGLRSQMKRSTSSFLLVFESPEELSAWMATVRKEIQAMGGKEYRPDEFRKPAEVESIQELHQRPSQRYLVKRDPNRFSQITDLVPNVTFGNNTLSPEPSKQAVVDPTDPSFVRRQSMATQQSLESRATSNTAESINQIHLDHLRESPRQSYASVGKTTSSSRDSSPGPSPVNLQADIPQWPQNFNERRQTTSMYHGLVKSSAQQLTSPNKKRRESTTSPPAPPSSHRISKYAPQQQRTPSPAAPNFSVPTFSKRYSSSSNSPALSCTTSKPQTPPAALIHASPSPPVISEEGAGNGRRTSIIGELQHLQKPSPRALNGLFPSTSTPPRSAGSCGPPSSSEGNPPFSRRFSSLEYSRGVSPLQLASHSPSPHPPPTTALPAIPGADLSSRSSFIKSPLSPLPPLPGAEESRASSTTPTPPTALLASPSATPSPHTFVTPSPSPPSPPPTALPEMEPPRGGFSYPPPTKALPAVPDVSPSSRASVLPSPPRTPSHESTAREPPHDSVMPQANLSVPIVPKTEAPHQSYFIQIPTTQESTRIDQTRARDLRRPVSMQVRSQSPASYATPPQTAFKTTFDFENITPPPTESLPSPLRPTRNPPPPPSEQRPQLGFRKSSPRIGREPPPVSAVPSPRSRISVISPATHYFDEAAPHPFIPPIKVSDRKFRGSLDGPWNPAYGAPQRTFLDLGAV
ncbi:hypothetical protein HO133_003000 [Letharia lupina]|uniref:PH domain-containing protein n=1 Tax=Letharia lupina TaxID=560253 RepID=A0A8H6F9T1_9LECA|nr:uncharacterized protein HO133_003000 [Letharia lupina]KAF6220567.1 hypothetical protein HO133_003000 [Letharia lupina]